MHIDYKMLQQSCIVPICKVHSHFLSATICEAYPTLVAGLPSEINMVVCNFRACAATILLFHDCREEKLLIGADMSYTQISSPNGRITTIVENITKDKEGFSPKFMRMSQKLSKTLSDLLEERAGCKPRTMQFSVQLVTVTLNCVSA